MMASRLMHSTRLAAMVRLLTIKDVYTRVHPMNVGAYYPCFFLDNQDVVVGGPADPSEKRKYVYAIEKEA